MSAPFGRVVDRYLKLIRYKSHPIVAEGERLKEPLLHLVSAPKGRNNSPGNSRRRRSQQKRSGPKRRVIIKYPPQNGHSELKRMPCMWQYSCREMDQTQTCVRFVVTNGGKYCQRLPSQDTLVAVQALVKGICQSKGWSSLNGGDILGKKQRIEDYLFPSSRKFVLKMKL